MTTARRRAPKALPLFPLTCTACDSTRVLQGLSLSSGRLVVCKDCHAVTDSQGRVWQEHAQRCRCCGHEVTGRAPTAADFGHELIQTWGWLLTEQGAVCEQCATSRLHWLRPEWREWNERPRWRYVRDGGECPNQDHIKEDD